MRFSVYDLLTVIPVQHLSAGIEFVIEMIEAYWEELLRKIWLQSTNLSKGGGRSLSSISGKLCILYPCTINMCSHSIFNHILFS